MKFIRASLIATLSALSVATLPDAAPAVTTVQAVIATVPAVVTVTTTQSPLEAAESALEQAKQYANQTLQVIIQDEHNYDEVDDSEDLIDQEVDQIVAAQPNTTQRWVKERRRKLTERERAKTGLVRDHLRAAKQASKAYKRAARQLERLRIRAGVPEDVYERDFQRDEQRAERTEEEAENYGDAAKSHVEAFYDMVKDELEQRNEREEREQEEASEQEQLHHEEGELHQERQQLHNEEHQLHHEQGSDWDADEGSQHDRSNLQDEERHETAAADAELATNPAPLNLRAAGPSAVSDGQGFLFTFACVGFLASMAVAVQMGSRPSIQQGRQPLLGA